jgi:hypothetical protein
MSSRQAHTKAAPQAGLRAEDGDALANVMKFGSTPLRARWRSCSNTPRATRRTASVMRAGRRTFRKMEGEGVHVAPSRVKGMPHAAGRRRYSEVAARIPPTFDHSSRITD